MYFSSPLETVPNLKPTLQIYHEGIFHFNCLLTYVPAGSHMLIAMLKHQINCGRTGTLALRLSMYLGQKENQLCT